MVSLRIFRVGKEDTGPQESVTQSKLYWGALGQG